MTSSPHPGRPPLLALTSLRFFAAFYVVLYHGAPDYVTSALGRSFIGSGQVAVDLFFVLSGFVLAYNYCDADGVLTSSRRQFWSARFARVYPVYVLSLVIGAPIYIAILLASHSHRATLVLGGGSGVAVLLLAQSWFYRTATSWNTPAWSLSVEAFFYLAFPMAIPWCLRLARRVGVVAVITGLWLAAIAIPVAYMIVRPDGHTLVINNSADAPWLDTALFTPLFHLPAFMIGAVAGWAFATRHGAVASPPPWLGAIVMVAILIALVIGHWIPYLPLHNGLLAPAFAGLICCLGEPRDTLGRLMRWSPLVMLGEASYALYLLHFPLLTYTRQVFGTPLSPLAFALFCVCTQLACLALYRWFEAPARRMLQRALAPSH